MMLIRTYRVRGHLAAELDPLGLPSANSRRPDPDYPRLHRRRPRPPIFIGGALGLETATVREIVAILRANYCGKIGLEYMHINDLEERRFLQERIEGRTRAPASPPRASRRSSKR
jgi:2-oxoglutarate dehydrogenase E1 component